MWRCSTIFLLGLALWIEPASAQEIKAHPLTVSIHTVLSSSLARNDIEDILNKASDLLQHNDGCSCKVGFKLSGAVTTFTSAPADITNVNELEEAHEVPADVKVVQSITFCAPGEGRYFGCAWRPGGRQRTVIISLEGISVGLGPVALAHEYGHTTGLLHRNQEDNLNLMTPCGIQAFNKQINQNECAHFRAGPVLRYPPGLGPKCPDDTVSVQDRTD